MNQQRAQLKKEIVQTQIPYLKKLKLLIQMGAEVRTVVFVTKYLYYFKGEKEPYAKDSMGVGITIPVIVFDTAACSEWRNISKQVSESKYEIDPVVYKLFNDILSFTKEYPFPKDNDRITIERSKWPNQEVLGRWLTLNKLLREKVEEVISLED